MYLAKGDPFNPSIVNNVQILTVDNDRDSGDLYTVLFESQEVVVTTAESIKEALFLLNQVVPDILICEIRFLGESVYPLIQRVRSIAQNSRKSIPIFVTSTCPALDLVEHLKIGVESYHIKPIDLNPFVNEVWKLVALAKITQPLCI